MGPAFYKAARYVPDAVQGLKQVRPMNWLEQLTGGGAEAKTYPDGTIAVNEPVLKQDHTDPAVVLAHELTHVRQAQDAGSPVMAWWNTISNNLTHPYQENPQEQDAFDLDQRFQDARKNDIELPAMGLQRARPR